MKEIKLVIDGKEIAVLTAEQIKALGIGMDDGCVCDKVEYGDNYYYINNELEVRVLQERNDDTDRGLFNCGNYYSDGDYAKQIAMHQHLNNLLRRYSEQHGGDKEWDGVEKHYYITFEIKTQNMYISWLMGYKDNGMVYFNSEKIAESAIEEVVEPFMKQHPDFVW